jgi:hypothetical protein
MFSTIPRMGTPIVRAMLAAFLTTIAARSCGEVTRTTPSKGMACITVSEASAVPGGRSTMRQSRSPQTTSPQNCLMAVLMSGPRQITASSSLGRSRLMDMTLMPVSLSTGTMPSGLLPGCLRVGKNILGILGPVMSASRTPTW